MQSLRGLVIASLAALIAACSSTPSAPIVPKGPDLTGNWTVTIISQMGQQDSALALKQAGNRLTGTISGESGSVPVTGTVEGDAVSFSFTLNAQGTELKIDQVGTLQGDSAMSGRSVFGSFGAGTFTAKKK